MNRVLIASVLGLLACGSSAHGPSIAPVAMTTSGNEDVVCGDEVSPTTGVTHRVCHKILPTSAETGEKDMICTDETPTGTNLTRRVCRSQVESEDNKRLARELYLNQAARPGCDPEPGRRCDGQHSYVPR